MCFGGLQKLLFPTTYNKKKMNEFNKQPCLGYRMQSQQFMHNADSLDDFSGTLVENNIVCDKKKMFGKQPIDMKFRDIDWENWPNVVRTKSKAVVTK